MQENGIKHTLTAPYHPASNGEAERNVQTLKDCLKKYWVETTEKVSERKLSNFLLGYRSTAHATTGVSPAELMLKRQLRTRLSLIKPDLRQHVEDKQEEAKVYHDKKVPQLRNFVKNERVRIRNFRDSIVNFVPGIIVRRTGPVNYLVRTGRNIRYVHIDHIIKSGEIVVDNPEEPEVSKLPDSLIEPESLPNWTPNIPINPSTLMKPVELPAVAA